MHLLILKLLVLGVHFFVIFLVSLNIRVQWRAGYNKSSWSSLFLGFSLLWLVLKLGLLLRWLEPEPVWTDALFYTLYWLPTTLQCAAFMMLPLFYTQVIFQEKWHWRWSRVLLPLYIGVCVSAIALMAAWISRAALNERRFYVCLLDYHRMVEQEMNNGHTELPSLGDATHNDDNRHDDDRRADDADDDDDDDHDDDRLRHHHHKHKKIATSEDHTAGLGCYYHAVTAAPFRVTSMLCFFVLAVCIGVGAIGVKQFGFRYARRKFLLPVSGRALYGASTALALLFFSHGVYDALVLLDSHAWRLPDLPLQGGQDLDAGNFAMFLAWEYIPMMLILITVAAPPPRAGAGTYAPVGDGAPAGVPAVGCGGLLAAYWHSTSRAAPRRATTESLPDVGVFAEIKRNRVSKPHSASADSAVAAWHEGLPYAPFDAQHILLPPGYARSRSGSLPTGGYLGVGMPHHSYAAHAYVHAHASAPDAYRSFLAEGEGDDGASIGPLGRVGGVFVHHHAYLRSGPRGSGAYMHRHTEGAISAPAGEATPTRMHLQQPPANLPPIPPPRAGGAARAAQGNASIRSAVARQASYGATSSVAPGPHDDDAVAPEPTYHYQHEQPTPMCPEEQASTARGRQESTPHRREPPCAIPPIAQLRRAQQFHEEERPPPPASPAAHDADDDAAPSELPAPVHAPVPRRGALVSFGPVARSPAT